MKETSRMSSSRAAQGSRPRTVSSPSYEVRPRIALSAVVLPAPLGPMIPRMRPSSTLRSIPSTATVVPKTLRSPRASMHAMASLPLLRGIRCGLQEFLRLESEPRNGGADPRPFFRQELFALALEQQVARARVDVHAEASFFLDE